MHIATIPQHVAVQPAIEPGRALVTITLRDAAPPSASPRSGRLDLSVMLYQRDAATVARGILAALSVEDRWSVISNFVR